MENQKKPGQRPQKLDTQGIRSLVLTLAVSATIGFWAIFSRLDGNLSSGGDVPEQFAKDVPFLDQESQTTFDLPPIPTLIPTLDQAQLAALTENGLTAPVIIGATLPTPNLLKTPPPGNTSPRLDKSPTVKKVKIGGGGGGETTKTRSSR